MYRRSGLVISRERGWRHDAGFAVPVQRRVRPRRQLHAACLDDTVPDTSFVHTACTACCVTRRKQQRPGIASSVL